MHNLARKYASIWRLKNDNAKTNNNNDDDDDLERVSMTRFLFLSINGI